MQSRLTFRSQGAALLISSIILPASAATWNYGTKVGLVSDWNDNPALVNDTLNPEGTFRFLASYDGAFERRDRNTSFSIKPRVTTDYYPDQQFSDLQATDFFLPGNFIYQLPASLWSANFNASRQSVLSSEETTSQGTPFGTLQGDDTLTRYSLTPSLLMRISEKDELLLGLSYAITDYNLEFTNRSDSDTTGGNFTYTRILNERHSVGLSGSLSSTNSDRRAKIPVQIIPPTIPPTFQILEGKVTTDSTSNFFTGNYQYAVSDSSTLSLSYGLQQATTESTTSVNSTGQSKSTGSLDFNSTTYDVSYETVFPRGKYTFGANRSVTVDITNGQPQDQYQLTFDGEFKFSERLLGGWSVVGWTQQAVALQALDQNNLPIKFSSKTNYASTAFRLDWRLARQWYLNSRYEYRWRKDDQSINDVNQNLTAVSNNISIGISYMWKELPK